MSPRSAEVNDQMRADALKKMTDAALREFSERGYHGATMKGIADRAGLSYGLAYYYFESKERIFRHLVDFALDGSIDAMRGIGGLPGRAWERIVAYSGMLATTAFSGDSSLYFVLMGQAMTQGRSLPGLQEYLAGRFKEYYAVMVPLIAEAQADGDAAAGDPALLAAAYFSFIQGLALLPLQGLGLEKNIDAELLVRVLRKDPAGRGS